MVERKLSPLLQRQIIEKTENVTHSSRNVIKDKFRSSVEKVLERRSVHLELLIPLNFFQLHFQSGVSSTKAWKLFFSSGQRKSQNSSSDKRTRIERKAFLSQIFLSPSRKIFSTKKSPVERLDSGVLDRRDRWFGRFPTSIDLFGHAVHR